MAVRGIVGGLNRDLLALIVGGGACASVARVVLVLGGDLGCWGVDVGFFLHCFKGTKLSSIFRSGFSLQEAAAGGGAIRGSCCSGRF